jgi:hypothetical protein
MKSINSFILEKLKITNNTNIKDKSSLINEIYRRLLIDYLCENDENTKNASLDAITQWVEDWDIIAVDYWVNDDNGIWFYTKECGGSKYDVQVLSKKQLESIYIEMETDAPSFEDYYEDEEEYGLTIKGNSNIFYFGCEDGFEVFVVNKLFRF